MTTNDANSLAATFAILSRAAAKKRIYAVRARLQERPDESRLLAAMAASEEVQARRIFNNFRGRIDLSENYLATIFTEEQSEILNEYDQQLQVARDTGNLTLIQALGQLRRAAIRSRTFFDLESGKVTVARDEQYHVCPFCGYLATGSVPDNCPVCGAVGESSRVAE